MANGATVPIGGFACAIQPHCEGDRRSETGDGGGGGVACAIRPHREVKPESGLTLYEIFDMKACRITTLFSGRGEGGSKGLCPLLDHIHRLTVTVHEPDAQTGAAP